MYLAELLDRTGLDVLEHLEREIDVPVIDGPQAQGDLIVIPRDMVHNVTTFGELRHVTETGVELVRGVAGNNPHTLVADPFTNTAPAYLIHPEHGGTGVAPGNWLVRRQQERGLGLRGRTVLVAD